ncbi:unnamed protein product [Paramecium pentaurelia]|uniref:Uncharacterized protein n=1 Tax=Paramecium pentaurelia TaxID=43138 RepID=A0A8S1YB55_9CILI|nr:unnamed protein product [Paramecium pentaurelia]
MNIFALTLLAFYFKIGQEITIESNSKATKIDNCLQSENGNCQRCDQTYFLFPLPQDHSDLGLKAGTIICVECPYQKFNEANNYYCGDCLDNSQSWDKSRLCTYDYKTKSTGTLSVFHKIDRHTKQLFYVTKSGLTSFTTQGCDGCEHFCKSQNSTCFQVQKQYSYDLNNMYISCAEGYEYSDVVGGCDPCPDNCKSCQINTYIKTDDSGKTVMEITKNCLICNQGFSILTTRTAQNKNETISQCIACFAGCETCYFGKDRTNLNEKPWDTYNNHALLTTNNFKANETKFYEDLFKLSQIAQRCEYCTSTAQSTFVPSLNRRSCVKCGTNCKRCEYTSEIEFPTRDKAMVVEPESTEPTTADIDTVESKYLLRCRECEKFTQTFQAIGTGCVDCSVANCKLCAKFDPSSGNDISTISPNFKPLLDENKSVEKCLLCEDGYFLSDDNQQCIIFDSVNKPGVGCLTYQKLAQQKCLKCNTGYTLYKNEQEIWECKMDCSELMNDYLCISCLINGSEKRCQRCLDGFFVDMKTGKCKKCSENGFCKSCYAFSLVSVHHSEYFDYYFDGEEEIYGPYCIECNPGDLEKGPFKNEDLRYCEKGGKNCAIFQAIGTQGYCDKCDSALVGNSRSSSLDGSDCIECPEYTIGCRERSEQEKKLINPFFDPTDEKYKKYTRISFICENDAYYNSQIARCISKEDCPDNNCDLSDEITIKADCDQMFKLDKTLWKINSQFNDITSKNATLILEDNINLSDTEKQALFDEWNKKAIQKITIILDFQYQSGDNSKCVFQKDTYFTSNIKRNVHSVQELELKIKTNSPQPNERIKWFIYKTIYFTYFTSVSLNGIELYPASDRGNLFLNIPKYESPFGFEFLNNTGSKFYLENVKIGNVAAEDHYNDKSTYTTPYSKQAVLLKKQKPFFTLLLNTYEIYLKNVDIYSQNYLLNQEISFQAKPFGLVYDSNIILPYLKIKLENVQFYDIAIESQALFELQSVIFLTPPQWNNKILINQVQFIDCYFSNDGGFLSTNIFNQPMGIININSLIMRNIEYNNSRGIIDFSTMQQIKVNNFQMYNSQVNSTALFHVTTLELSSVYLHNTSFTYKGRLMQTKYELKTIRLNDPELSGLKLQFFNLEFDQVICLTPACLILISEIQNEYDIPINITMKGLIIKQINTTQFDQTILEAATSASIRVEKSNILLVSNFQSIENADLTIFYVEQVWTTKFINLNCYQKEDIIIRNNYCLFINNPYKGVEILNAKLLNLIGRDNSFIGISSWSNLIYNTSTADYLETIIINGVNVAQCTIVTTVLAVPSSAILIDSTQMQIVKISFMNFQNNHHLMEIDGSLRPSNPTFLMRSLVGTLILSNSVWKSNFVQGFGAVLYLEVGTQIISNISMMNSNFDFQTKTKIPPINEITEGGHLYISAFNLNMNNCNFTNSTSRLGGALFLRTLKEGIVILKNIRIRYAYTPLNGAVSSRGGCLYIDSMASQLDMEILGSQFYDCFTRGEGGGIFLMSYDKQQQLKIQNSELKNCYALSGLAVKTLFYSRTQKLQKMILQDVKVSGNQSNSLEYLVQLGTQQQIEKFLFIKRFAAVEQDYGQIEIFNCQSEGLFYYGFLSIWQANYINLNNIQSQHSILSFRPYIEILEPQLNPLKVDSLQFRNISSISINNLNCTLVSINGLCRILQVRLEFPDFKINPALLLFDLIQEITPLKLLNIAINKVICMECHGGLVQIMRVSNIRLIPLVEIINCRCSSSESSYYGCFSVSSDQYFREQVEIDNLIGTTLDSNLTDKKIIQYTNFSQTYRRILQSETINQTQNYYNFTYIIPNPPYLSNVIVQQLNIFDVKAVHGGGISFYGLTVNATKTYCSTMFVTGRGGCIYFESYPKDEGKIQHRINIADSSFYRNNASIGGAIAVVESGINNFELTSNTFIQTFAKLFGNEVSQYPTQIGIKINKQLQKQSNLDPRTGWLNQPINIRSGQKISQFENQTVVVVFLDKNNRVMDYQYDQKCSLSANYDTTQGNISQPFSSEDSNRDFILDKTQGFNYSNQIINYDPYSNHTLDIVFNSSHINIPIYHNQYPYQIIGFETRYKLEVRIRSVECQIGEKYSIQDGTCTPCEIGSYSLIYKDEICKRIDYKKMNETYMNKIKVQQYFWRSNYESDVIEECKNKKDNCIQGFKVGNDLCQFGLIGALCEECDIYAIHWGESFYNSAKFECQRCQERTNNKFIIFIICLIIILGSLWSVYSYEKSITIDIYKKFFAAIKLQVPIPPSDETTILKKIILNYIQLISLAQGFMVILPQEIIDVISIISMPTQSLGNTLDCLLADEANTIDIIYLRLIWSMTLILICIIVTILLLYALRCPKILMGYNISTMFIYMLILLQPTFLIEFANLIIKRDISDDTYIQANVSYKYYTNNHSIWLKWFAYPGFIIILFLPLFFLFLLIVADYYDRPRKNKFQRLWGYLYREYIKLNNKIIIYWEFIRIYIRAIICFLYCIFAQDITYMVAISSIFLFFYLALSKTVKPYHNRKLNQINYSSSAILLIIYFSSTVVYLSSQNENIEQQKIGLSILIILTIIFFLLIIRYVLLKYSIIFAQTKAKIIQSFPGLISCTCGCCDCQFNCVKEILNKEKEIRERTQELWQIMIKATREGIQEWNMNRSLKFKIKNWDQASLIPQDEGINLNQ